MNPAVHLRWSAIFTSALVLLVIAMTAEMVRCVPVNTELIQAQNSNNPPGGQTFY
ncbi:hypothetical protein OC834_003588 [Tilletia horrida]|nr:hypothetical protein OC834_003588 [Tilletia horrida]